MSEKDGARLLPCPECGAEAFHGDDTQTEIEREFEFAGTAAVDELPGKECPECGEVFAL